MSTSHEQRPGPAARTPAGGPGRTLPALLLALALPTGGAAGPALEYGPEAENRFVERCAGGDAAAPASAPCRRWMERLQAELGYAAFLEAAADALPAFEQPDDGHSVAAERHVPSNPAGQNIILASSRQAGDGAMHWRPQLVPVALSSAATAPSATGRAQAASIAPSTILAPRGWTIVLTLHAQGAQIYDCRSSVDGRLAWQFREPVATLLEGGRTVGRHYTGPSWELAEEGTKVTARVAGRLPGAGTGDIPWLRLDIVERRGPGGGPFAPATAILRVNTVGGVADGPCTEASALRSVAYAADYVFLAPSPGE